MDGEYNPFLLTCLVGDEKDNASSTSRSDEENVPVALSLVVRKGDRCTSEPSNLLRIERSKVPDGSRRQKFGICVKGISFSDPKMAVRIVEWIELLFLLGADRIIFHYYNIAEEIREVLNYYHGKDMLEFKSITWGGLYSM